MDIMAIAYDVFFDIGFDNVLDEGVGFIINFLASDKGILYFGPNPDPLYQAAISSVGLEDFKYVVDIQIMSRAQLLSKINDILFDIGLQRIITTGVEIKIVNKWPANNKNNVLYIGPNKEI